MRNLKVLAISKLVQLIVASSSGYLYRLNLIMRHNVDTEVK